jgi:hypothetical protein
MKDRLRLAETQAKIGRYVALGAWMVLTALLSGCHQTPTKPEQPVNDCRCACDTTHSRSSVPCTGDPLDEPHPPVKSSTPL